MAATPAQIRDYAHEAYEHAAGWLSTVATQVALTALIIVLVLLLGRFARRSLEGSARRTSARHNLDEWKTRALVSRTKPLLLVINATLVVAGFIVVLYVWGLQTGFVSMLTAAGFAGIVIGLAAANTLSNFIAGFQIFYNHPFDIGDWVEIDGVEGLVTDVKAGATMIETWDGEKVTFPNRLVEGTKVRNFSHQRKLRRRFLIGVDYGTDIRKVRTLLLDLVKSHPHVLTDPEPQVIGQRFADSAIELEIRYWVLPLRVQVMLIQTWLMEEIQRLFAREGIVIPYPQRTLLWRHEGGNPTPGETLGRHPYDPDADERPFPGPPLQVPKANTTAASKQSQPLFRWFPTLQGHRKKPEPSSDPPTGTRDSTS